MNEKKYLYEWYELGLVSDWVDRDLPQLTKSEITLNGKGIDVLIVEDETIGTYPLMKMAVVYDGNFLPIYEDGTIFTMHDDNYASIKIDGVAYLGVLKDES
ncbi:hypothetical protein P7245_22350 [Vibrio parahaemolyticus]|nr:hypothetical protein [Vibrio parahaemolyticus]